MLKDLGNVVWREREKHCSKKYKEESHTMQNGMSIPGLLFLSLGEAWVRVDIAWGFVTAGKLVMIPCFREECYTDSHLSLHLVSP